ncbi:MAG TPA: DUF523 and DUF1722 domain-containing protein [Planctomycetota bacterium]|nr:DUF523 and DUF1722 domain-containing protein [Planctomycetota bacterium]
MPGRARPILAMSLCLGDAPVRYDGAAIADPFVKRLLPHVELKPVCPEVEIGLGIPRDPIRIDRGRLVQPSTGADLTERMRTFADRWLSGLGEVDGFLLKSRSPSCGIRDTKRFRGGRVAGRGAGLFAEAVLALYPHAAVEDEARLSDGGLRERFLTKLFALAELRRVRRTSDLARFHARQTLLLTAYDPASRAPLGRLAASTRPFPKVLADYRARFAKALSEPPRPEAHANLLERAIGPLLKDLAPAEKAQVRASIRTLRSGRRTPGAPIALLRAWLKRTPTPEFAHQSYLDPYPETLADGDGRGTG